MSVINITKVAHFSGHNGPIYSLSHAILPNEFYSGGNDGYVVLWNIESKGDGKLLVQVNRPVYSLCIDRANSLLFCGAASGNLHVVDLVAGKEIRNIEAHTLGIFDIRIYNNELITCGGDGAVKIWSLSDLKLLYHHQESTKSARCMDLNSNQNIMAVGFSDFKIRLYQLSDFTLLNTLDAHTNSVFTLAFTSDGKELISGGRDVMIRSWLVNQNYKLDVDVAAHNLHINHIAFNPSGKLFASVSMDKTIKIWSTENFKLLKVIDKVKSDGHLSSVNKCLWFDDHILLTGSDDRTIMMWKLETEKL